MCSYFEHIIHLSVRINNETFNELLVGVSENYECRYGDVTMPE